MRCLVTGGSGFVGRFVVANLVSHGFQVDILGRSSEGANIATNIAGDPPQLPKNAYDVVYHLAGRAHVNPRTESERQTFFAVNVQGTKNLLSGLEKQAELPRAFVLASTVAVYGITSGEQISENSPRRAADAYGLSKRQAEDVVLEWGERRGVRIGIVRLPLVVGPGAPGNLRALIEGIRRGRYVRIGRGRSRRSMVNASDVAKALPRIAKRGGIYHLTDGIHPSFVEIETAVARALQRPLPPRVPVVMARCVATLGDWVERLAGVDMPMNSRVLTKMLSTLTFDDTYARKEFGWAPESALSRVHEWCRPNAVQ